MKETHKAAAVLLDETEQAVDMGQYRLEDWLSTVFFWALGAVVFLQFFTRYVMNDSASWTEEIARYLLIAMVFIGAAIGVRRNNHIQVDLLYHYFPKNVGRALATLVDAMRIIFLLVCCVLCIQLIDKIGGSRMAVVDLPMGWVYGAVLVGFVLMTWRATQLALRNWTASRSTLEDQEIDA